MSLIAKFRKFSTTATTIAIPTAKKMSIISDFASLSKFRLTSLVSFTTAAGFLSIGLPMDFMTLMSACVGTSLCAGSASTFNQVFEKSQDMKMKRTSARPLPSGRVSLSTAVSFGVSTGVAGTMVLYLGTNPVVAALGIGNIVLYSVVYTFSKRYTEYNTWVGSIVGAIPPVMGCAAASGGTLIAPESIILSSILFLWQFPHFFALSWMHRQDYARGGFSMVPVNDPSGLRTAALIQEYSLYLTALPIIISLCNFTSYMFAVEGTAANIYLLSLVYKFKKDRSNANARKIFLCSLWYLPLLLVGYVFHAKTIDNNQTDDMKLEKSLSVDSSLDQSLQLQSKQQPEVEAEEGVKQNMIEKLKINLKNIFKQVCIHEVIVYWNKTKSTTASSSDNANVTIDTTSVKDDKNVNNNAGDDGKSKDRDDSHMCMKIKSDQVNIVHIFISLHFSNTHHFYKIFYTFDCTQCNARRFMR